MAKKKNDGRSGRLDKAAAEIKRLWGDMEVIDAKQDLRVFVKPCDIAGAKEKDPSGCVLARSCKRLFDSSKILIFRTVAYVDLPGKDGVRHVERFIIDYGMRDLIVNFDTGKPLLPEGGFLLKKPRPCQTFESVKAARMENRRKAREQLVGEVVPRTDNMGRGRYRDEHIEIDMEVRSGTGAVHFSKKKVKSK